MPQVGKELEGTLEAWGDPGEEGGRLGFGFVSVGKQVA